jgi:hypothetical protein
MVLANHTKTSAAHTTVMTPIPLVVKGIIGTTDIAHHNPVQKVTARLI